MLFLGSSQYPEETGYKRFLSQHNGRSNASTSGDHTRYVFEIQSDAFEPALDRFASQFVSPLFSESSVDREIHAVDKEYMKNLVSDDRRIFQCEKYLSRSDHVYSNFGTGNLSTLLHQPRSNGINIRDAVIDFFHKTYSANLMRLVVYARESLDELEAMVVSKFSAVANKNLPVRVWDSSPLGPDHLRKFIRIQTLKQARKLHLVWQLQGEYSNLHRFNLIKPEGYVTHLLGHEADGSILAWLKKKKLALTLSAGVEKSSLGFSFLRIAIDLTDQGKMQPSRAIRAVFAYIRMLEREGAQRSVWQEIHTMQQLAFRYREKGEPFDFVAETARQLHFYSDENILIGPFVSQRFDAALIEGLIKQLSLGMNNLRCILASDDPLGDDAIIEPNYKAKFSVEDLKIDEILKNVDDEDGDLSSSFRLPSPNEFIPTTLLDRSVLPSLAEDGKDDKERVKAAPVVITHTSDGKVFNRVKMWFKENKSFNMPKAVVYLRFFTTFHSQSSLNNCFALLYLRLFEESINDILYHSNLAGLSFSYSLSPSSPDSIFFSFGGYHEKLPLFITTVLRRFFDSPLSFFDNSDQGRENIRIFEMHREKMNRNLSSFEINPPHQIASYYLTGLLQHQSHFWYWEKLAALARLTPTMLPSLNLSVPFISSMTSVEGLCHGCLTREEATDLTVSLENILSSTSLSVAAGVDPFHKRKVAIAMIPEKIIFHPKASNDVNSAIVVYFPTGKDRLLTRLYVTIFRESFFSTLRTKEQLGYIVNLSSRRLRSDCCGVNFVIQSNEHPVFLWERIEAFLISSTKTAVMEMPDERFDKYKVSLADKLREKPKKMVDEADGYWSVISDNDDNVEYLFDEAERDANLLLTTEVSKAHLLAFIDKHFNNYLHVHMWSKSMVEKKGNALAQLQGKEKVVAIDENPSLFSSSFPDLQ